MGDSLVLNAVRFYRELDAMPKEKLTKRKMQGRQTRQKLFETSIALFEQHGYENVTIDDICGHIGVSKGAFYTTAVRLKHIEIKG